MSRAPGRSEPRQPIATLRAVRPLPIDYARPGMPPPPLSNLKIAIVTVAVTVGAIAAMGLALFILGSLVWLVVRP